jgi:hypothetical protein
MSELQKAAPAEQVAEQSPTEVEAAPAEEVSEQSPNEVEAAPAEQVSDQSPIEVRVAPGADHRSGAARPTSMARISLWVMVVLIPMALGGLGGGLLAMSMATTYRAEAIVVPVDTHFPVGQFPVLAQAVFRTDAVMEPVISTLALATTPHQLLTSGLLSIEQVPTGGAVNVVATTRDAELSRSLANVAAQTLVKEMEATHLGTVSVFTADSPGQVQPKPVIAYAIIGSLAGLVLIVGLLLAVTAIRSLRASLRASRGSAELQP